LIKYIKSRTNTDCWGFYLNCGEDDFRNPVIKCGLNDTAYLETVKKYINFNPGFIGACCGSNVSHVRVLNKYLRNYFED